MDRYRTIISALLAAIAYQWVWPLACICFIPMFNKKVGPKTWFTWGISFMAILHLFLIKLSDDTHIIIALLLWGLTSVYFGCFYGIVGWVLLQFQKITRLQWHWLLPLGWPFIEWLKSIGRFGNPNGNLGLSLSPIIQHIPIYSIIGHIGVSTLIIILNICLYQCRIAAYRKKNMAIITVIIGLMITLNSPNQAAKISQPVAVVQTGVDQHTKQNPNEWATLEREYIAQLKEINHGIIIMPETILPTDIKNRPFFNKLQAISTQKNSPILVGSFIQETQSYNGSYFIQPNRAPIIYKKQQLMPFGETLPFRHLLSKLIPEHLLFNDFDAGSKSVDIAIQNGYIRPIICLEGIYSRFYRSDHQSMVAILANNAWFNTSSAGDKLLKFAQIHAAEFQTPVYLSANYGTSAIINASGRALQKSHAHHATILRETIRANTQPSLFNQWPWAGSLAIIVGWVFLLKFFHRKTRY